MSILHSVPLIERQVPLAFEVYGVGENDFGHLVEGSGRDDIPDEVPRDARNPGVDLIRRFPRVLVEVHGARLRHVRTDDGIAVRRLQAARPIVPHPTRERERDARPAGVGSVLERSGQRGRDGLLRAPRRRRILSRVSPRASGAKSETTT
jgi:hypothetical protein